MNFDELLTPNLDKIFENERKNLEKDSLLKKLEKDNSQSQYQLGYNLYEKLSKLYSIYINSRYKCTYDGAKLSLDELDAYIEEPFNVDKLHCENESTRKRLIKMIESCSK